MKVVIGSPSLICNRVRHDEAFDEHKTHQGLFFWNGVVKVLTCPGMSVKNVLKASQPVFVDNIAF